MPTLHPYLTFSGNCREAMNHYQQCLGGEVSFIVAGESPVAAQIPPTMHNLILHSALKTTELELFATDMQPEKYEAGTDVHMCLVCKTEEEAREVFSKLSAEGKVLQPLHEMFFGWIGSLSDKFGKRWIVECNK